MEIGSTVGATGSSRCGSGLALESVDVSLRDAEFHCKGIGRLLRLGSGNHRLAQLGDIRGTAAGPLSVEIEFKGEPWPSLAEVNKAMKSSYKTLSALGLH